MSKVSLDLGGYPVVLSDTAGIRESSDPVEAEGIHRALHRGHSADLRLFVFDASVRAHTTVSSLFPGSYAALVV